MASSYHPIESQFRGITLIAATKNIEADQVINLFPGKTVFVCDAYVDGIEIDGNPVVGGFQLGNRLWNIDHHAPVAMMQRPVSSTPLAIEYVVAHDIAYSSNEVVVNHSDADSVLSACIIRGILPPDERFGLAAIAADHTGEENDIADLLQPCGKLRNLEFSIRNLQLLLKGESLESEAQELLDGQRSQRREARELVEQGKFTITSNGLAWINLDKRVDGVFFPALLPEAKLIVQASPVKGGSSMRIGHRLGLAAPEGKSLNDLKIPEFDTAYGGRWNAGNNSRAGGTTIPLEEYVEALDQRVAQYFS